MFGFCSRNRIGLSGLDDSVGTDAGCADLDGLDGAIVIDFDSLKVRAECALRVLHDMHTDTAFLLGKTSACDMSTKNLVLSANFTNSAHRSIPVYVVFVIAKKLVGWPGLEPGTPALKVRCCYRLSYHPNGDKPKTGANIRTIFISANR